MTDLTANLKAAEAAFEKAQRAKDDLDRRLAREIARAEHEARNAVMTRNRERFDFVTERLAEATRVRDVARIAAASARSWNGYPVGAVLHEWANKAPPYLKRDPERTGRTGVVIVWDDAARAEAPSNLANYSLPKMGDLVLRPNKKDGTPSKLFVREHDFGATGWLPEGRAPLRSR